LRLFELYTIKGAGRLVPRVVIRDLIVIVMHMLAAAFIAAAGIRTAARMETVSCSATKKADRQGLSFALGLGSVSRAEHVVGSGERGALVFWWLSCV